ncbi:MAG: DUF58 domain-containing protein [Candidatus Omnitrophica bacterium]|nr:DUF58 domain-containing protein [Candidatus Omnitrophota bacterium]
MFRKCAVKWGFLLLIAAANFIIGYRTSIKFFYFFFGFLFCFIFLSLFYAFLSAFIARISFTRKAGAKVVEDDALEIEVTLSNKTILPLFNVVMEDALPCAAPGGKAEFIFFDGLAPGSTLVIKYNCACPDRGIYMLGPFKAYFFDPLGLFFFEKRYNVYSQVYVYPRVFPIYKFPRLAKGVQPWFGINTARSSGDEDEFFGVREYKDGDPIKRIHWPSTAKKNRLIVKQFQNQSFHRATVIFNLEKDKDYGQGKESIAEYTVRIAASVCKYLFDSNVSIEMIAHAGEIVHIPFNRGSEHLDNIFKFLAMARPESGVGLAEIIPEFLSYIPDDTTLIIVATVEDLGYIAQMLPLAKGNISLIPLVLISSTFLEPSGKLEKADILKDINIHIPGLVNFNPVFFTCGVSPQESFLKISQ